MNPAIYLSYGISSFPAAAWPRDAVRMSKRYVFWRGPDSKPISGSGGAPTEILRKWGMNTNVSKDGNVSWDMFKATYEEAIIMAVFIGDGSTELNGTDTQRIVVRALRDEAKAIGGSKPILAENFVARANELAAEFYRTPISDFIGVTSISVQSMPVGSLPAGDGSIRFLTDRRAFRLPKVLADLPERSPYQFHIKSTKYQWVAVPTSGRSWAEALDRFMHSVSLLRAFWTFGITYGRRSLRFGSGISVPLAAIHIGPVHTLHRPDGEPVSDEFYWRDSDPRPDRETFDPRPEWERLKAFHESIQARLLSLPYRQELENILIRYIGALDSPDYDVASLQMWSLLEAITNTIGRYEETAKRAAWIWTERTLGKQVVECLRIQRNRFVHVSRASNQPEDGAYLMKGVIEPLIQMLIDNGLNVTSLAEVAEVLALPTDALELARRKSLIETAIHVHGQEVEYVI